MESYNIHFAFLVSFNSVFVRRIHIVEVAVFRLFSVWR